MSILVELPERLHQPDAFAAFSADAEFSIVMMVVRCSLTASVT
jgi:hypothetical protein